MLNTNPSLDEAAENLRAYLLDRVVFDERMGGPVEPYDVIDRVPTKDGLGFELRVSDLRVIQTELTNLRAERTRVQRVVRSYVEHVDSGEHFGALVSLVPGLVSDDGAHGSGPAEPTWRAEAGSAGLDCRYRSADGTPDEEA